ncbi:hypothetical protein PHET_04119 [Paragonimus heterotremus]|uniref:Kinesin motor domain-containing protein n=1 Tax=Paragonimus heterotremus TaxID=100268 RepID=A0A8J4TBM3_9TREM|nr:hypothetical protein PHET_04119 [Paragonimus heterotremus]
MLSQSCRRQHRRSKMKEHRPMTFAGSHRRSWRQWSSRSVNKVKPEMQTPRSTTKNNTSAPDDNNTDNENNQVVMNLKMCRTVQDDSKEVTANTDDDPKVIPVTTPISEMDYSTYSRASSNNEIELKNVSGASKADNEDDDSEKDVDVIVGGATESELNSEPTEIGVASSIPLSGQVERKLSHGLPFSQRVRNAWNLARGSHKNEQPRLRDNQKQPNSSASPKMSDGEDTPVADMQNKGDRIRTPVGHLQPWPVATHFAAYETKRTRSNEETEPKTEFLLRQHTENLINSLKDATLKLARRDMEMQRLITVNSQLGERYCRMRTQYAELAREQAKLRQRYDMLLVKGMDREQLHASNVDMERQLDDLRTQLAAAEERATQSARRISRMEAEAKEVAQNASTADVQVANLRAELQRKEAQIHALTCRQYLDATREMRARAILNELIELKGNIRVIVRCHSDEEEECMFRFINDDTLMVKPTTTGAAGCQSYTPRQAVQSFRTYRVLQPGATQRVVFDEVSELITSCVDGYSVSITAYGQTGSGKTYTMLGAPAKPGLIPRIARHLITQCQQRAPLWNYRISIAVIQIHKEQIIDLLSEPASPTNVQQLGRVTLHDNGRQILLRGAHEVEVSTEEEILEEIRKARARRQVSASLLNTSPSYLHFIVFLRVRGMCKLMGFGRDLQESGQARVRRRSPDWLETRTVPIPPPPPTQPPSTLSTAVPSTQLTGAHSKDEAETIEQGTAKDENELDSTIPVSTHGLLVLSDLAGFDSWNPSQVTTHPVTTPLHATPPATVAKSSKEQNLTEPLSRSGPPTGPRLPRHSNHVDNEMEAMEAKQLGRSLITMARVFDMLADTEPGGKIHVPFRDSKLTHLLKPTLTGDAKFVLIVTLNTRRSCLDASMRSLKLAAKASSIALGQAKRNAAARRGTRIGVR